MKETKVYVDELPECCSGCVCVDDCYCGITQKNIYYEFHEWTKPKDCPLIDIKTHDRELVKEVCEKIHNDLKPYYGEEVSAVIIERVLSNLQKEFEK